MTKVQNPLPHLAPDNGFPRRARLDLCHPVEIAIMGTVDNIEELGADLLLTEAIILLNQAREKVADWLEGGEGKLPEELQQMLRIITAICFVAQTNTATWWPPRRR